MYRVLRVIINSFGFVAMCIVAYVVWQTNPWLSLLFALSAFDQFEDVYYYVYNKRLLPRWALPLDLLGEGVLIVFGLTMLVMSVAYYVYFSTWFFRAMLILSILIVWSSVEDVIVWVSASEESSPQIQPTAPSPAPITSTVFGYVCKKEEVCEKKGRFVVRRHI